ncbi:cyclin-like protein [Globomyces pollinis-pini]|nr:cyclin-like protein [Globomyces pollinis-pini]
MSCHNHSISYRNRSLVQEHRNTLTDWILNLNLRYYSSKQTGLIAMSLVDSYCCQNYIELELYQCLGAASFLIASKFYESDYPSIIQLVDLSMGSFTKRQLIDMELSVLFKTDWNLRASTAINFLDCYLDELRLEKIDSQLVHSVSIDLLTMLVKNWNLKMKYPLHVQSIAALICSLLYYKFDNIKILSFMNDICAEKELIFNCTQDMNCYFKSPLTLPMF